MSDSQVFGVSVRGWLTVAIVSTVCIMQGCGMEVDEPLYSLVLMVAGFYLGQKNQQSVETLEKTTTEETTTKT